MLRQVAVAGIFAAGLLFSPAAISPASAMPGAKLPGLAGDNNVIAVRKGGFGGGGGGFKGLGGGGFKGGGFSGHRGGGGFSPRVYGGGGGFTPRVYGGGGKFYGPRRFSGFKGSHRHRHHRSRFLAVYPYAAYGAYYYGDCGWLRRRAQYTGSSYWWRRYEACLYGDYY